MNKQQRIRLLITREAARLMYEEGVKQYLHAKRTAAKRIIGNQYKYSPKYLPSNGEISDAVYALSQLKDPDTHEEQLFRMRCRAVEIMEKLEPFSPRLIGSVSTGRIRAGSDIDLHVFCDDIEEPEVYLESLGWRFEREKTSINVNGKIVDYQHIHLDFDFPVELSVYPLRELRVVTRSSTDGKPINRLTVSKVRQLIIDEHWALYLQSE
ncbi:nucleotidyltransferase domain-containing protein [Microbulbifer hainanensis]|uniref:nucleotidyltransferase n=1 Tax=Microbulbifer hainanensis TaxID=2735675 RepID=UPI001866FC9A|nr:nucleotidyltransferase [Microbulbifer hainanensis]